MNFFKAPELTILNGYPKNQAISIRDYLCDFVINNPLNFPYSSFIIKRAREKEHGTPVKEYFKRESVLTCIDSLTTNYRDDVPTPYYDMLHSDDICFTSLALCTFRRYPKSKLIIHQNGDDIILSIVDGSHKHIAMMDKSASSLLCYHTSDSLTVYQAFQNHFESVAKISEALDISNHFYFEFTEGNEMLQKLCMFMAVTTIFPPSWYASGFRDECCRYEFKNSIMDDYNILRLCDSDFDCVKDAAVKKITTSEGVPHPEEATANDLLNKVTV